MAAAHCLQPGSRSVAALATASLASCLERFAVAGDMRVYVTYHALLRYIQRVERVSLKEARRRIMASEKIILSAAKVGCSTVVLPCRARLVLEGAVVVTVRPPEPKRSCRVGSNKSGAGNIRRSTKGRQGWRYRGEMEQ